MHKLIDILYIYTFGKIDYLLTEYIFYFNIFTVLNNSQI